MSLAAFDLMAFVDAADASDADAGNGPAVDVLVVPPL
jgi:hypothetical protein